MWLYIGELHIPTQNKKVKKEARVKTLAMPRLKEQCQASDNQLGQGQFVTALYCNN